MNFLAPTIVILGAGGFGREVGCYLLDENPKTQLLFIDDDASLSSVHLMGRDFPVQHDWFFPTPLPFLIGTGLPKTKKVLVTKALAAGLTPHPTFIHRTASVFDVEIGMGGVITPNAVATTNIRLGDYVLLNWGATVGHDSILGDFVTCFPGSAVSGYCHLAEGVLVGAGAVIREHIHIGPNTIIGAQAFVNKDSKGNETLIGVPARSTI